VNDGYGRTLKFVGLAGLVVGVLLAAYKLSSIFNPLLIALLLAYISDPLIGRLEKVFKYRLAAIVSIYLYLLVLFILIPSLFVGRLYTESNALLVTLVGESSTDLNGNELWDFGEAFTDLNGDRVAQPNELFVDANRNGRFDRFEDGYFYKVLDRLKAYARSQDAQSFVAKTLDLDEAIGYVKSNLRNIASVGTRATSWLFGAVAVSIQGAFEYLSFVVLIPVYTFFFLYEWNDVKRTLTRYLPGQYRARILDIVGKVDRAASSFFRGRLISCLVKSLLTAFGLWLCGIRFALFIGLLAGFLSFIPFLGVLMGAVPALTLVLIDHQGSTILLALVLGVERKTAVEFSFLLGIPTLISAGGLQLVSELRSPSGVPIAWGELALGTVVSAVTAFVAVRWLLRFVQSHTFEGFGYYRIVLGLLILLLL